MLPLAFAHGSGAELQKPLAIIISGGMITATFLTLPVLPVLYYIVELSWIRSFKRQLEKEGIVLDENMILPCDLNRHSTNWCVNFFETFCVERCLIR